MQDTRLARLRALTAHLDRLPASPARDALLRETRHRMVVAETGVDDRSAWRTGKDAEERELARLVSRVGPPEFPPASGQAPRAAE